MGSGNGRKRKRKNYGGPSIKVLSTCVNCGGKGPHYAPPGFGSPGMFICEKKEDVVEKEPRA